MYGHEEHTDPACAKSWTGFIIIFADCPVFWQSKLQTETALSTMEAKIIALSACCRELFPIMDMVSSVTKSVQLPIGKLPWMSPYMKTIREHLCWQKLCLHSIHPKANTTQSRQFGFVEKSSREMYNYTRLTLWKKIKGRYSPEPSQFDVLVPVSRGSVVPGHEDLDILLVFIGG